MIRKKEDRLEAADHSRSKTRNQRWIDFLQSTTPPSCSNLRRYHRHQGRYCRIENTTKTDSARLEARISYGANSTSSSTSACGGSMTGPARTRGFDGPPAEVNATTIRNPRGGSDGSRTYLLRQPHDSNNEVGRRVARGTRRWAPSASWRKIV